MKIYRRFPIVDFADVPLDNGEILRVKYKYPTQPQLVMIGESSVGVMSVCKYVVEDIENLEDESGNAVRFDLKKTPTGTELRPEHIEILINNDLALPIARFYQEHFAGKAEEKKSSTS